MQNTSNKEKRFVKEFKYNNQIIKIRISSHFFTKRHINDKVSRGRVLFKNTHQCVNIVKYILDNYKELMEDKNKRKTAVMFYVKEEKYGLLLKAETNPISSEITDITFITLEKESERHYKDTDMFWKETSKIYMKDYVLPKNHMTQTYSMQVGSEERLKNKLWSAYIFKEEEESFNQFLDKDKISLTKLKYGISLYLADEFKDLESGFKKSILLEILFSKKEKRKSLFLEIEVEENHWIQHKNKVSYGIIFKTFGEKTMQLGCKIEKQFREKIKSGNNLIYDIEMEMEIEKLRLRDKRELKPNRIKVVKKAKEKNAS